MMTGKAVPEDLRSAMGNRLIGCDECQKCCPHNPLPPAPTGKAEKLDDILADIKLYCEKMRPRIGSNLTIPNRVLAQACVIAGNSKDTSNLSLLNKLCDHPSAIVAEHATWAVHQLEQRL